MSGIQPVSHGLSYASLLWLPVSSTVPATRRLRALLGVLQVSAGVLGLRLPARVGSGFRPAATCRFAAARMLVAALMSRSWTAPQGQVHSRTFSGIVSATTPQTLHSLELGNQRSIRTNVRPYRAALYSSMPTNADHPASWTD